MELKGQKIDHNFLNNADEKTLKEVSSLLRNKIIDVVSKNGGHLSSNLGIIELTVSLIKYFDPFKDDIIFDVGHQTYAFKILTGRNIESIRKLDGIAPFSSREECLADRIDNGHSSTSLSIALGMALAKKLKGDDSYTIAVIGDGSISNGLAFEALNQIALQKNLKLIIILNDNEMSISKNSGSFAKTLSKIRTSGFYLKNVVSFKKINEHKSLRWIYICLRSTKNFFKKIFVVPNLFSSLGIDYNGPFDGNSFKSIANALTFAKNLKNPIVLHFKTKKGLGYSYAQEDEQGYWHGIGPFDIKTGEKINPNVPHMTDIVAEKVYEILQKDQKAVLICSAMVWGAHLSKCFKDFKERTIDVGIAEEHSITFASGLALKGYHPIVSIYSTFLQRGYDEILHDVARQKLGILFLVERAGLVGADGSSHQGIYDNAFLKTIPNTCIYHPENVSKMKNLLDNYQNFFENKFPTFIRISHEKLEDFPEVIENYKSKKLLITYGQEGNKLAKLIENKYDIYMASKIHPLYIDKDRVLSKKMIIIYDCYGVKSGFAEEVLIKLNELGYSGEIKVYALPDEFISSGTISELLKKYNLDADSVSKFLIK